MFGDFFGTGGGRLGGRFILPGRLDGTVGGYSMLGNSSEGQFLTFETPENVDSRNLQPLISGKLGRIHETLFLPFQNNQRTVRDERWKLHVYPRINHRLLFDLQNDPHELHNLAEQAEHADQVTRLMAHMKAWRSRLGDPDPLKVDNPLPLEPRYDNSQRILDRWQPDWIRNKYFGSSKNGRD